MKAVFEERTRSKKLQDWAEFAGVPVPTLGNFLNGKTTAGPKLLKTLARVLKVPVDEIENPQPLRYRASLIQDAMSHARSRQFDVDGVIRFILDHVPEQQMRDLIDKSLDSGRYEVARFLIDYTESKWPSGGMKK